MSGYWITDCVRSSKPSGQEKALRPIKLYLLIAAYADFHSWTAVMSFSEIEDMTRLSRPMVNAAVKMLTAHGLIIKGRVKQTSSYELVRTSAIGPKFRRIRSN